QKHSLVRGVRKTDQLVLDSLKLVGDGEAVVVGKRSLVRRLSAKRDGALQLRFDGTECGIGSLKLSVDAAEALLERVRLSAFGFIFDELGLRSRIVGGLVDSTSSGKLQEFGILLLLCLGQGVEQVRHGVWIHAHQSLPRFTASSII